MIKKISLLCAVTLILALSGCDNSKNIDSKNTNKDNSLMLDNQDNYDRILFNPFLEQLVKYDDKTGKTQAWNDADNQFQYPVPNSPSLYIDGNSINNHFKLIEVSGNSTQVVYEFKNNEGVFPIAFTDNKLYFVHTYYNQDGSEKEDARRVATFNLETKQITDFKNTSGLIVNGVINNTDIFYTTYNRDKDEYDLYKIQVADDETNSAVKRVKSNLDSGDIYVADKEICISDSKYILCHDKKWDKNLYNQFVGSKLIQVYSNDASQLTLRVIDTTTANEVFNAIKLSGFAIKGDTLIVGTDSGIQKYKF